jgi:hypothetical protein
MGLVVWIIGIVVGIGALGYVYHRWTSQTTAVINQTANVVNQVIDKIEKKN